MKTNLGQAGDKRRISQGQKRTYKGQPLRESAILLKKVCEHF